jgi:hypothetical protein
MPGKCAVAFLLFVFCGSAEELPKLPPETMGLIDEARAVAPEFKADLLLRLAGSPLITEPKWKRALIEEAFLAGASAQLPYPKSGELSTDARASRAHRRNDLEGLTLQTRAVEAMLALDARRALAMFEEIRTPQVPAMTCQDVGTPDLSGYYRTAATVFARAFTAEERKSTRDLQFLEWLIGMMESPAHLTPGVRLVFTVEVTPGQRLELVTALAGAMVRIKGTSRVFSAATWQLVPVSAPIKLPEGVRAAPPMLESAPGELPAAVAAAARVLIPELRSYIVRHVSGPRCSEYIEPGKLPSVVNDFNYYVGKLDPAAAIYKPISEDEAKPAKDEGTYVHHEWWQSSGFGRASKRSVEVMQALKWLNHGNRQPPGGGNTIPWTPEERMSAEWNAHFLDTLKLIEGWKEDEEEASEDWFGMVSEAYEMLAEKAPPGEAREAAMVRYLSFMETHYSAVESHNLWFTQLHNLWRSREPWMQEKLTRSANPVIATYAKVNRAIPQAAVR